MYLVNLVLYFGFLCILNNRWLHALTHDSTKSSFRIIVITYYLPLFNLLSTNNRLLVSENKCDREIKSIRYKQWRLPVVVLATPTNTHTKKKKKRDRCYIYKIFTTNYRWLVVISSNFKLTLKLLFCLNNNIQTQTK